MPTGSCIKCGHSPSDTKVLWVFCESFQCHEHGLEITGDHRAELCGGRPRYFRTVNYPVVTRSGRYDSMVHRYPGLIYNGFVREDFVFLNVNQGAHKRICSRGLHGESCALCKRTVNFDVLDSGVPLFPARDIRKEFPYPCGRSRGVDALLMSPHL